MPRLTISELEKKDRAIKGSIKNAQELQGMNVNQISKVTGIPTSSIYKRLRDPETFTVRELRLIFKALRYPVEEKERFGREMI